MFSTLLASGLLNPEKLLEQGGLLLLTAIVFAESGLLIGFFLPGDSLLFIAGFLSSSTGGNRLPPLPLVVLCVVLAAFVGDQVGYWFGNKVGPSLFDRPKSRFFNPANVVKAHSFFDRYGPKTIVLARFVPIVRTFAPVVAGVGTMKYRTFVTYNLIGGAALGGRRHHPRLLPRRDRRGQEQHRDRHHRHRAGVAAPGRHRAAPAPPGGAPSGR